PLFAQAQQPNAAELAQKVVSIISCDKPKTQTYWQILDLSDELDQADQQKDREKAEWLSQKINELQKKLGPEYLALLKATKPARASQFPLRVLPDTGQGKRLTAGSLC